MRNPKTVFLIEDDADEQLFFTDALSSIGNAVLCGIASNGSQALRMLQSSTVLPDIVFMDVQMPGMSGIECLERIKTNTRLDKIVVVMLSTAVWEADTAMVLGAKAFIRKTSDTAAYHHQLVFALNEFAGNGHQPDAMQVKHNS